VLALVLAGASAGRAHRPAKELTPAEREQTQKQVTRLTKQAEEHYYAGRASEAVLLLRQVLELNQRLYPADKFPDGHPDLAESLNSLGFVLQALNQVERALPYYQQALEMNQRLYPADKVPGGHPNLAVSLNHVGGAWQALGQAKRALPYYQQALEMNQRLYPADKFPDGHPHLAICLNNLGFVWQALGQAERALPTYQQALEMNQRLHPKAKHPDGHPNLALSLNNLGHVLQALGQTERALPYYQQALEINQRLYPADKVPGGHPNLAVSLNNLGGVLKVLGQTEQALPYYQQALEMNQRLYSADRLPNGHPHLAGSLNNLGSVLQALGQPDRALPYFQQALAMRQRLYPADRLPDGHPDLAQSLNNLAGVLQAQGQAEQALPYFRQALEMCQRLYPADKVPDGHPDLAQSLNNLGYVLEALGQPEQALPSYQKALAMFQRLYPADKLPDGHPRLALCLDNLGSVLEALGQPERALPYYQQALEMYRTYLEAQAATAPEAQALDLLASLPRTRDGFLTLTRLLGTDPGQAYPPLWLSRSTLTRLLQQRQRSLHLALADSKTPPEVRQRWQRLLEVLRGLSALPGRAGLSQADRDLLFRDLTAQKEELERQLARDLPPLRPDRSRPAELVDGLPEGVAFLDFFRYLDTEKDRRAFRYVAFVLSRGQPVRRVELGAAQPLDDAIDEWLGDVSVRKAGEAVGRVSQQLWPRLTKALPPGTHTLYLAPDGNLSRLPWAALPTGPGKVLLESHRLAVVPHGPFLLERLPPLHKPPAQEPPRLADDRGRVLAVGGVHADLPASKVEVESLRQQAAPREVLLLDKNEATPTRVLKELSQVTVAHLATHGFFDETKLTTERLRLAAHRKKFREGKVPLEQGGLSVGLGLRNPLVYTGLELVPDSRDPLAVSGRVTGETLVAQPLPQLRLCVLSACRTGVGKLTDGEGVMGLQRAFHLAGCPNVVASLWNVNDEATAALMAVFYDRLWHKGEPPLEALRQAQLAIYYHPERIPALAKERGPKLKEAVDLPLEGKPADEKNPQRAPTKLWAAFVLSGVGR